MENLSSSLLILSEKIKIILHSYSEILKENELLKNKILLLENDITKMRLALEQKRDLLDAKDEDAIFVSMLIEELLEGISSLEYSSNKNSTAIPVVQCENLIHESHSY